MKKIIASLAFAALATPALAHGISQPSLLKVDADASFKDALLPFAFDASNPRAAIT